MGVGRALFAAVADARPDGFSLRAFTRNTRARLFYEALGCTLRRRSDGSRNEEDEPDCTFSYGPAALPTDIRHRGDSEMGRDAGLRLLGSAHRLSRQREFLAPRREASDRTGMGFGEPRPRMNFHGGPCVLFKARHRSPGDRGVKVRSDLFGVSEMHDDFTPLRQVLESLHEKHQSFA